MTMKIKYDFETVINRGGTGSSKWEQMKKIDPNISSEIIPFSVADMELKHPPEITAGLKQYIDTAILGYTRPTAGYLDSVCQWMAKRHDWRIEPQWIVGTPGVVSAFFQAVKAFTDPGDQVIVQTPVYYPFYAAVEGNQRVLLKNSLIYTGSSYEINFEDLAMKASDPRTRILLFCSPHNPVGRVWTAGELARIGEICLANDVMIISDEIHFDLVMPGYRHRVFADLSAELAQNMIVCTAPSKTFNLAGMQNSNIIIPNGEIRRRFVAEMAGNGIFSLNILGYKACEIAYTEGEEWLEQLIQHIYYNHLLLKEYIAENIPEIKVIPLQGTYLQWMDCRGLGLNHMELEKLMLEKGKLFFDEGYIFGEEGAGFERMNLACPTRVLKEGLQRLETAVSSIRR